ncbi:hypothetical protein [Nocardia sp. NBC_01327]|uniref:hypothetical protein n=1 Tax=Nocardia sp. NBC_01327 TaxID=2903593 RepID=UPI002E15CA26|nr:hypothetical protein OG326_23965 [Nocardia sp. NBC_01327]
MSAPIDPPDPEQPPGRPPIGDHGITPAGDRGHAAYSQPRAERLRDVVGQVELHEIRNPVDWRAEVDRWGNRRELHDALMFGLQAIDNRTAAQGYENEYPVQTPHGWRRFDVAAVVRVPGQPDIVAHSVEIKAGYTPRDEALLQLQKEEYLLRRNTLTKSEYVVRTLHDMDAEVLAKARELEVAFPDRFGVRELSPEAFERAVSLGRPIVQARAVERMREAIEQIRNVPELAVARDAITKLTQEIERGREAGAPIPLQVLLGGRADIMELVAADRDITQRTDDIARDRERLPVRQALLFEEHQAQSREERQQQLLRDMDAINREIDRAAEATAAQARPDLSRELEQVRELADQAGTNARSLSDDELARTERELQYRMNVIGDRERDAEQRALEQEGLHPAHVDQVADQLDKKRAERDREIQRSIERVGQEVATRENQRQMDVRMAEHNRSIERAGLLTETNIRAQELTHLATNHRQLYRDHEIEQVRAATKDLTLEREQARALNAQVYDAFKAGHSRYEPETSSWVLRIEGREVRVSLDAPERSVAEATKMAEKMLDPRAIDMMAKMNPAQPPANAREVDDERAHAEQDQARRTRELERQGREREMPGPT